MIADHAREADQEIRGKIFDAGVSLADCSVVVIPDIASAREDFIKLVAVRKSTGKRIAESFAFRRLVTDSLS